ncbi:MAG: TlpA disulfide reductase family protein [Chloroflexota bacterium]
MNEQIIKEHRRTPWIMLGSVLALIAVFSLPFLRPGPQPSQNVTTPSPEPTSILMVQPAANNSNFTPSPEKAVGATVVLQPPAVVTPFPTPIPVWISGLTVGQPAPDFSLKTLDGGSVTLSSLRGQPVIVNFWASWCYPCRLEMPELERTYQAYQAEGLTILGVNVTAQDSLADAQAFVAEFTPSFPILLDETGDVTTRYGVRGIPTSYFIDRRGIVTHVHLGALNAGQLDEFAKEIMAGD